jgi:2,3-bisphosphoglycerate-dependent phosphoglycerate mutase
MGPTRFTATRSADSSLASTEDITRAMRSLRRAYLIGVEGVTEIWLVRHADVYDGLEDVPDPPLSRLGEDQAERLARRLQPLEIRAVYSSPHQRALQTAEALTDRIAIDPRLAEARASYTAGKIEIEESPADVIQRMRDAVDAAVAAHSGGRVVMVTHGIAILNYLCDVLELTPGTLRLFPDFTSISVVRIKGDRRMAGALCDTAHLGPMP